MPSEQRENRIRYTGQQYDGVTEQYYLRARYYNPVLGRFLQEDVYQGDGLNLYAYCGNNPVMYWDPSGYAKKPGSGCPPNAKINEDGGRTGESVGEGSGQGGVEARTPLEDIKQMMKDGTKTADGKNILYDIDDKTKIIFRMDVGENAHKMNKYGYPDPVNHINIEIQTKSDSGRSYVKWDYHIIFDNAGNIEKTLETGPWSKR